MADLIIEDIPEAVHRALLARSVKTGHTIEDEIREILEDAVRPAQRIKLGSELARIGREVGGADVDIERDTIPVEPINFE